MRPLLALAAFAALLPLASASAAPLPAAVKKAVTDYAPVIWFHPQEAYLPVNAEKYVAASTPTPNGGLKIRNEAIKRGDLASAKVYVHVKVREKFSDIQYWVLYGYNGPGTAYFKKLGKLGRYESLGDHSMEPCGRHEGDWEMTSARVDNATGRLLSMWLNQHDAGQRISPAQALKGGRVVLYASKNGHAHYATEDRHYNHTLKLGVVEFRLLNATAKGKSWDTRKAVQLISAHDLRGGPQVASANKDALAFFGAQEPQWMSIKGRWGLVKAASHADVRNMLATKLGGSGAKVLDKLGGVSLIDKLLAKAGIKGECLEESGPGAPWTKKSWLGGEEE